MGGAGASRVQGVGRLGTACVVGVTAWPVTGGGTVLGIVGGGPPWPVVDGGAGGIVLGAVAAGVLAGTPGPAGAGVVADVEVAPGRAGDPSVPAGPEP